MAVAESTAIGNTRLIYQLNRTSILVGKKIKKPLMKHGLSLISIQVLELLHTREPGTVYPSGVARETGRVRHDISGVLERMERDGLITFAPNAKDGRSRVINLTAKGRQVYGEVKELPDKLDKEVYGNLTSKQQVELRYLLGKLTERLE